MKATLFLLGASFLTGADAPPAPAPEPAPAPTPVVGAPAPAPAPHAYPAYPHAPAYHGSSCGSCGGNEVWCEEKGGLFSRWKNRSSFGSWGGHGHSCNDCTGCGTYAYTDYCDTGCNGGLFGRLGGGGGLFSRLFKRGGSDCCEPCANECNSCGHGHHHGHVIHGSPGCGSPGCGVPHVNPITPAPAPAPADPATPGEAPKSGGEKLPDGKQTAIPSAQPLTVGTRSPF